MRARLYRTQLVACLGALLTNGLWNLENKLLVVGPTIVMSYGMKPAAEGLLELAINGFTGSWTSPASVNSLLHELLLDVDKVPENLLNLGWEVSRKVRIPNPGSYIHTWSLFLYFKGLRFWHCLPWVVYFVSYWAPHPSIPWFNQFLFPL